MIYPLKFQIALAIIFTIFGIFIALAIEVCQKIKFRYKLANIIMQIVIWIIVGYSLLKSMLTVSNGYVPIYTFLFFFLGYLIYYKFLKKDFSNKLGFINKNKGKVILIILPKATFKFIRKIIKRLKEKFKNVKINQVNKNVKKKKNKINLNDVNGDAIK